MTLPLLPGTAVGRAGAHWLSCCYVLRGGRGWGGGGGVEAGGGRSFAAPEAAQECVAQDRLVSPHTYFTFH